MDYLMIIVMFFMLFVTIACCLIWAFFDERYVKRLVAEHQKEWDYIKANLNIVALDDLSKRDAVHEAYYDYIQSLMVERESGLIKYCGFPHK